MRRSLIILTATCLVMTLATPTIAGEPPPGTSGTGIAIDPTGPRTPAALGFTSAYAASKAARLATAMAASSAAYREAATAPMSSTGTNYLSYWAIYHQKTGYYCLPAVGQSILAWNFGTATYVGSTVATSQGVIARAMGTGSGGTDDYRALSYVNGQFARWASAFRYVPVNDVALANFQYRIVYEIDAYHEPLYVRVNVTSPYYVWHQTKYALHATVAVGYWDSGASSTIADPYTASSSGCPEGIGYPGYSSAPDYGCVYFFWPTSSWFKARSGVVDGELPEWY